MIIKSSRNNSKFVYKPEENPAIVKEEVKSLNNEIVHKTKKKKFIPAIVVEETPVVAEEEEKIDLSEWLKDDIEE